MARVLVVDDSPVDRQLAVGLLSRRPGLTAVEKRTDLTPVPVTGGREALAAIAREPPDLVLTDLQMPEMNGLELVQAIKAQYPHLPVILMTAHGSEDIAIEALRQGAASYVPKRHLAEDLVDTIQSILTTAAAEHNEERVLTCMTEADQSFVLDNDPSMVMPLVRYLEQPLKSLKLCNANGLLRTAVSLREALLNAIYHGNLEVASALRDRDEQAYEGLAEARRRQEPYRGRRIYVQATFTHRQAAYVVRDEGPGFDLGIVPNPKNAAALGSTTHRGLFLIRTFMDEVTHNDRGNQITLVRHRD
jgi:CheY-like chemotaxis protein